MKFFDYVNDRGGRVILPAMPQPKSSWKSNLEVFEESLKHEQSVTARIHKLYELALADKDYATQTTLQWFINEQVEEEKAESHQALALGVVGRELVEHLRDGGDGDSGLSGRVYAMLAKEMSDTRNRGKIVWVGPTADLLTSVRPMAFCKLIDAYGKTVMPGLVDPHIHIESSMMTACAYAEGALLNGTTTIF